MPYMIAGNSNGAHLLSPETARTCPACGLFTHREEDHGRLGAPVKVDFSLTEDGFAVVSDRFRAVVDRVGDGGVAFRDVGADSFLLMPRRAVFLDVSRALERALDPCKACGRLTGFLGDPTQSRIMAGQQRVAGNEIVRSVQTFGSGAYFDHVLLFGDDIHKALKAEGLKRGILWYDCPYAG